MLSFGTITLAPSESFPHRLRDIHERLTGLMDEFRVDQVAVEEAFFAKNVHSALRLGEVRGVVMLSAAVRDLPVHQYPPAVVKKSITGYGQATKEQIQYMVRVLLCLDAPPPEDAADALAIALCHAMHGAFPPAG